MGQSIGIHLGEHTYRLVALEGSLKRHKLVNAFSGEIPSGEDAVRTVIEELRERVREEKLRADNVYLAIDSGAAAFRTLTLPFDDRQKIEEVIKFEVEGNLPQYDIDQVVVDFQVLGSKPGVESNLLVTAVPKDRLGAALHLCEKAGLEALDAELEGTALFDAAYESGILQEDAGSVLIYVGDTSTTVVVADGRRLASLRAIRVGARSPRTGEVEGEEGEGKADLKEDKADKADKAVEDKPSSEGEGGRLVQSSQRIRRELVRTLSGARTQNEIKHVFVCGHELPGLRGHSLLDVPIQPLPFTLAGADPASDYVVAYGAALRGFEGGTLHPHLRREELRFSGRFERLELPLAVLTLLLFTFLFVQYIVLDKQLEWRDEGTAAHPGDMQIWLMRSNEKLLPDTANPQPVRLPNPPEALAKYAAEAQAGLDHERTKFEELMHIRQLLKIEIDNLSKELGQASDIKQPQSALTATTLVFDLIASMGESVRIGIRRFDANYQHSVAGKDDLVLITMDADFFGNSPLEATNSFNQLVDKFKAQPWCVEFESRSNKELTNAIQLDGLSIQVNVDKASVGGAP